jgi:hypothetical protein
MEMEKFEIVKEVKDLLPPELCRLLLEYIPPSVREYFDLLCNLFSALALGNEYGDYEYGTYEESSKFSCELMSLRKFESEYKRNIDSKELKQPINDGFKCCGPLVRSKKRNLLNLWTNIYHQETGILVNIDSKEDQQYKKANWACFPFHAHTMEDLNKTMREFWLQWCFVKRPNGLVVYRSFAHNAENPQRGHEIPKEEYEFALCFAPEDICLRLRIYFVREWAVDYGLREDTWTSF